MTAETGLVIGFMIGSICMGILCAILKSNHTRLLKKTGRIKFEATEKLLEEIKK